MPRKKVLTKRMQDKLLKALSARTPLGWASTLIDAIAEEGFHD